jgi:hypothetical protein
VRTLSAYAALMFSALVGLASPANALVIPFADVVSYEPLGFLLKANGIGAPNSITYTHDITDSIDVATDIITGGTLTVRLLDVGGSESTQIKFDLGAFITLTGNVPDAGTVVLFNIDTDLSASLMASLQTDGKLNVTVKVLQHGGPVSDVLLASSTLVGTAEREDTRIPEPSSLFLLGAGLIGMATVQRRRQRGLTRNPT